MAGVQERLLSDDAGTKGFVRLRANIRVPVYGLAVSAKRYVVYTHKQNGREIIKPSEHGLGIVYVPDKRPRYKPVDCKDQETDYPRWIVEAWERLLVDH